MNNKQFLADVELVYKWRKQLGDIVGRKYVQEKLGCSESYARSVLAAVRYRLAIESAPDIDTSDEQHDIQIVDWRDILKDFDKTRKLSIESIKHQDLVELSIEPSGRFVPILFSADWHIGSYYTNLDRLADFIDEVIEYNIKISLVGDIIDNFVVSKIKEAMMLAYMPTHIAKQVAISIIKDLHKNGVLLNFVLGNHELFDAREVGATLFDLVDFSGIPISRNRAKLHLNIGGIEYKICEIHKSRKGRSYRNPTHQNVREYLENCPDVDMVVSAHTHLPGFLLSRWHNKWVYLVTLGTTNNMDTSRVFSGASSADFSPIFLFDSEEKQIIFVNSMDQFKMLVD